MDCSIDFDVNIVSELVGSEIYRERDVTLLPECSGEGVARTRPHTVASRHFASLSLRVIQKEL